MAMKGRQAHIARLKRISGPTMERRVSQALFAGAERIAVAAQISITAGSVSGKGHVPSAPGQPPNQDTGVLAGNIEATLPAPLRAQVASNAPYSAPLEYGTSRMAARPFMAPARDQERQAVIDLVQRAVSSVVRGR